jgi:hypothetical protein
MKIRVEIPKGQHPSITLDRHCPNVGGCMRPCGNWCPQFQDWFAELTQGLVRIPICGHVNVAAEPMDNETAEYFRGEDGCHDASESYSGRV